MRKILFLLAFILSLALLTLSVIPIHAQVTRLGILGDSNSDEYRADDNRAGGTPYEATTLNWAELLQRYRALDLGTWGSYGEPRRSGYAYNWARSASLACDTPSQAQGLAGQGVEYALIFTGTNDFHTWNGTYDQIYSGGLSGVALQTKLDGIVGCITSDVVTLQEAGVAKIVLVNIADPSPFFAAQFPDANKRQRVTDAISFVNTQIVSLVQSKGIKLADLNAFTTMLLSRVVNGQLPVGGEFITLTSQGDEPHHFQLAATVGHLGTVGNGLLANFFLGILRQYGLSAQDFTDTEILNNAGIGIPPQNTPTLPVTAFLSATPTNTPSPSATTSLEPSPQNTVTCGATLTPLPTATPSWTPTKTATPTRTTTPTRTLTPSRTPIPTRTFTPTVAPKVIRLVSRPNSLSQFYAALDGIVEDGVFTEVTSARFTYTPTWLFYPTGGRNGSPTYASITNGWQITFNTFANTLTLQTFKSPMAGSLDVYVNGILKVSYNGFGATNAQVDVNVPLG